MSAAHRCKTCACCGRELHENDKVSVEPLLEFNAPVRYVAVLWDHSSFTSHHTKFGGGSP